jgi:hypothetical protein
LQSPITQNLGNRLLSGHFARFECRASMAASAPLPSGAWGTSRGAMTSPEAPLPTASERCQLQHLLSPRPARSYGINQHVCPVEALEPLWTADTFVCPSSLPPSLTTLPTHVVQHVPDNRTALSSQSIEGSRYRQGFSPPAGGAIGLPARKNIKSAA